MPPLYCVTVCLLLGIAGSQVVDEFRMMTAVQRLSDNFSRLKTYGLAVDGLQREYSNADITYSTIDSVSDLFSSVQSNSSLNTVLDVFNDITSNIEDSKLSVDDCCTTTIIISKPCCYGCSDLTTDELQTAAYKINDADLDEEVEFRVGFTDGSVLVYPPVPTEGSCTNENSRLTSWYNAVVYNGMKEIVVFLDLNQQGINGNSSDSLLRESAINVILSLSIKDKVGLVLVTDNKQRACPDVLQLATPEIKSDLIRVIEETLVIGNRDYRNAYSEAGGYFSNNDNYEKLLVLITDGRSDISATELDNFKLSQANSTLTNKMFKFSIYTANDVSPTNMFLNYLSTFSVGSGFSSLTDVADYSSVFSVSTPDNIYVTSDFNRQNELSLSISKLWRDGNNIVGAVNALLPWRYLMSEITEVISPRPFSYYFILSGQGDLLYHDSFDTTNVIGLSPGVFETESEFTNDVLVAISSGVNVNMLPVNKTIVTHDLEYDYTNRIVPSHYSCQTVLGQLKGIVIYTCVVLAIQDTSIVKSFNVRDVSSIYKGDSSRLPIYSQSLSLLPLGDTCNAFCLPSVDDRFSVQFTSLPISSDVSDIVAYIDGTGTRPVDIEDNIAEELSVTSAVGRQWLAHRTRSESAPIKRRHLATPSGIYLGYPAVELNTSFVPQYSSWYRAAITNNDVLSLSVSRTDILDGVGVVYTASFSIINNNVLLSVLAADVTKDSLMADINEAFDDDQFCEQDNYNCLVLNDQGYTVLNPNNDDTNNHILDFDEYDGIVKSLIDAMILQKIGCNDVASDNIDYRVYYRLSIMDDSVLCYTPTQGCFDFCIGHIKGTNSFLLILKSKTVCATTGIKICGSRCNTCNAITPLSVECPCNCVEDICTASPTLGLPVCPAQTTPPSNYAHVYDSNQLNQTVESIPCELNKCCGYNEGDCILSPSCNWCSSGSFCSTLGSCCSGNLDCCLGNSLPACIVEYCLAVEDDVVCPIPSVSPSPEVTEPSSSIDRQAAIIGGVIGGVFGLALLALLIGCCVWYQFIREPDSVQAKVKSDFNFTDMKVSGVNKTAIELKGVSALNEGEDATDNKITPSIPAQLDVVV